MTLKLENISKMMYDFVLLERKQDEEISAGGIILPQASRENTDEAIVVAVGQGKLIPATGKIIPLEVQVGDKVVYNKRAGRILELDGKEYLVVTETDIFGVVEDEE